jgi:hypothetical protein
MNPCIRLTLILLILIPGCAAYKELEPDPKLSALERGYIELKDGKDNFELDKDNKYFITFPSPPAAHFYLVLVTPAKPAVRAFLTSTFNNGRGPITPIPDEQTRNDSVSVYAIDWTTPVYHWVIDSVKNDLVLALRYRYVPQWRYRFENKYAEFQDILAANTLDRSTYLSIDANFNVDRIDIAREVARIEGKTANLTPMNDELLRLESIFPQDIAASRDTAYQKYLVFKGNVDDELTFQNDYAAILGLFKREKETRGDPGKFLEEIPHFTQVLSQKERFTAGSRAKASRVLLDRLAEVKPYLENNLRTKSDIKRISPQPSAELVGGLYQACGQRIPAESESIIRFINRFNAEVEALEAANRKFEELQAYFNSQISSPTESFYTNLIAQAGNIKGSIPEDQTSRFERYGTFTCAVLLAREIMNASNRANDLQSMFQTAHMTTNAIGSNAFRSAELQLRELHETRGLSDSRDIASQRLTLVKTLEDNLFNAVRTASRQRIDAFIKEHEMAIDGVAGLHADSAFLPVYELTFASAGSSSLLQKKRDIDGYLEDIKFNRFPESSIRSIYNEFNRNMRDRGVEKARAIVEHGKFYRGADKQIKGMIDECDVDAAKWIVKPREYRRLLALPVTSNQRGVNEYVFRIRLQIPSEAQFPVFDVTLKLPKEIADKAGQQQWYEAITIDRKHLLAAHEPCFIQGVTVCPRWTPDVERVSTRGLSGVVEPAEGGAITSRGFP